MARRPTRQSQDHHVVVEIKCLDKQTSAQAQKRLHRWLETFGHTSPNHGFEILGTKRLLVHEFAEDK